MHPVGIGIGSNQKNPILQIQRAVEILERSFPWNEFRTSSLYASSPVGPIAQDDFVNSVCTGDLAWNPREILKVLQSIEVEMGRVRAERWGPRVIDLDLLFCGDWCVDEGDLAVPHPEIERRGFVMVPLHEVMPGWVHPRTNMPLSDLIARWGEANSGQRVEALLDPMDSGA